MERLTLVLDELGRDEIAYSNPSDPEGCYNILDLAKHSEEGDGSESGLLLAISKRLAAYEDTGLSPEEIMDGSLLTGWISVDEQLPKVDIYGESHVIVHMNDGFIATVTYDKNNGWELWAESGEVTHWMPLPAPPKE